MAITDSYFDDIGNPKYCGRFKQLRHKHELSIEDVAKLLGYSASSWGNWERGRSSPTGDILWDIADFFGVTVDYLVGRTDDNYYYRSRYE